LNEISGFAALLLLALFATDLFADKSLFVPFHLKFGLLFLVFAYILQQLKAGRLVNPVIRYVGQVSYSMYLVHFCILYWMEQLGIIDWFEWNGMAGQFAGYILKFVMLILGSLVLSTITYKLIEQPVQQWGKKLILVLEK
jgi:peptidoglycan/LPS O-acetylase OafA/YrhL